MRLIALVAALLIGGCGGGGGAEDAKAPTTPFNPFQGAKFKLGGKVAKGAPLAETPITIYDAAGKSCSQGKSGADGAYAIEATCAFPVLVVADTPDLEGKALYSLVPTIAAEGESVKLNLTPISSVITQLVLEGMPKFGGVQLSKSVVTAENVATAKAKVGEVLNPILEKMGASPQDFLGGDLVIGEGQDLLMDALTITLENVPTTSQNVYRFQLASEHRPVTLVQNTKQDLAAVAIDRGLGVGPEAVSGDRLKAAQAALSSLKSVLEGKSAAEVLGKLDACFRHQGSTQGSALFEMDGALPGVLRDVELHNFNTFSNLENQTEEVLNGGGGDLAYVSFDYADGYGLKGRSFTWMIRGSQSVGGCSSNGSGWRLLGNQRPVKVITSTYALHRIMYNSSFAGRTDQYGTGTEHIIQDAAGQFAYAIVSGPGLADNGMILVRLDGGFYRYGGTVSNIRANAAKPSVIFDAVEDTRSWLMNDVNVAKVTDGYYSAQNRYVVRFFKLFSDLYPSLTLVDRLPKRPYLNAELPVGYFPSVAVNLDALVTALQTGSSVGVNWSNPVDLRGKAMLPAALSFVRKNCAVAKEWPGCGSRSKQINEYGLGWRQLNDASMVSSVMTPPSLPPADGKTFESRLVVHHTDSLARPIITEIGMSYQR